jgi:hypothetical protein
MIRLRFSNIRRVNRRGLFSKLDSHLLPLNNGIKSVSLHLKAILENRFILLLFSFLRMDFQTSLGPPLKEQIQQINEDEILDNFCHMVLEEFLIRRNLKDTLQTFRREWNRPQEVSLLFILYASGSLIFLGNRVIFLV